MYNSVIFLVNSELYKHCHNLILQHSIILQKPFKPICSQSPGECSSLVNHLPTFNLYGFVFFLDIADERVHIICSLLCMVSFTRRCFWGSHRWPISVVYSLLPSGILLNVLCFAHSPVGGVLNCFLYFNYFEEGCCNHSWDSLYGDICFVSPW